MQDQVKPLLPAPAASISSAKAISWLSPMSRGRAGHAAHIGRELQNNMTMGMDRGKGEELEPSLKFSLPP